MILRKILFVAILTWFTLTVLGYGIYKALPIILGPSVTLTSPVEGESVQGTSILVQGTVLRAKALYVNQIATPFTESGTFVTRIPVYTGSNLLTVQVLDRFGRSVTVTREVGTK